MAGKSLFTADTLSRAPCSYSVSEGGGKFTDQEVESFADAITDAIPIVQSMLIKFRTVKTMTPYVLAKDNTVFLDGLQSNIFQVN